jgi:hypothetical protein
LLLTGESDKCRTQQSLPWGATEARNSPHISGWFSGAKLGGRDWNGCEDYAEFEFRILRDAPEISVVWGEETTQGGSTNEALNRSAQTAMKRFFCFDLGPKPGGRGEAEPGEMTSENGNGERPPARGRPTSSQGLHATLSLRKQPLDTDRVASTATDGSSRAAGGQAKTVHCLVSALGAPAAAKRNRHPPIQSVNGCGSEDGKQRHWQRHAHLADKDIAEGCRNWADT